MRRLLVLVLAVGLAGCTNTPAATSEAPHSLYVEITYKLTGTAQSADLTYTDASGNIQQSTGIAVPLTTGTGAHDGMTFQAPHGMLLQFSAQNDGPSGNLDCAIEMYGAPMNVGHATGGYANVSCSFMTP